jgi:hypothetical protein
MGFQDYQNIIATGKNILIPTLTTLVVLRITRQISLIKSTVDVHLLAIFLCLVIFLMIPIFWALLNNVYDYGLGLKATLNWSVLALVSAMFAILFSFLQTTPNVTSHGETEILIGMLTMIIAGYAIFMLFYNSVLLFFKTFKFVKRHSIKPKDS